MQRSTAIPSCRAARHTLPWRPLAQGAVFAGLLAMAGCASPVDRTVATGSVQKNARHPVGSFTITTRINPPAGFHVARNVLYFLTTSAPYNSNVAVDQPRR